jgi:hypothetical protein
MPQERIKFRRSTLDDVFMLHQTLRDEDLAEIKAGTGYSPYNILEQSLAGDYCYTAYSTAKPHKPMAMFGVGDDCSGFNFGILWCLVAKGTFESSMWRKGLMNYGRLFVKFFLKKYEYLYNSVYEKNTAHVNWLKRIGATMHKDDDDRTEFIYFDFTRGHNDV